MNTTHNSSGSNQLVITRGIAARATLGGFNDSDCRRAYYPVKKPTKFVVTLKPVSRTENHLTPKVRSTSGCCCNASSSLNNGRLNIKTHDAYKAKPVQNAFRVLTNSKFISIDPTYNIDKDPILSAALNSMRLTAGSICHKKSKVHSESAKEKRLLKTKKKSKKHHVEPEAKKSDASTSTHIIEPSQPPPEPPILQLRPPPKLSRTAKTCAQPPAQPPPQEKPCPAPPPPLIPPPAELCAAELLPQAMALIKPPRLTFMEFIKQGECPPNLQNSNKIEVTEPPKKELQKKQQQQEQQQPPENNCTLADVTSRIIRDVADSILPPETCDNAVKYVTEICKPREMKNHSTGLIDTKETGNMSNAIIEQQCSRIKQLESEVEKLRQDLTKMQADFIPQKDMLRCTALTKKLQELNALLVEVKNKQQQQQEQQEEQELLRYQKERRALLEPSSTSNAITRTEKLQNRLVYSEHANQLAKRTVNLGVQVNEYTPRRDSQSQTTTPTYTCTATGDSPVTSRVPSTECTTPRTVTSDPQSLCTSGKTTSDKISSDKNTSDKNSNEKNSEQPIAYSASYCPFCERIEFPERTVSKELFGQVLQHIGRHSEHDIVLAVLLQSDNVYHINIATISGGESLGCVYASEAAINEAHGDRLFEEFLTFFIVDARNAKAQKCRALGHTFEFFKN